MATPAVGRKRWPDLTIRVSTEDDIIETSEAGGAAKRLTKDALGLTEAEFKTLQGLAITGGDLAAKTNGAGLPSKTRQTIKRLRAKLKKAFPAYEGDPLPRGKVAFKIESLTARAENEIARLQRESRLEYDGASGTM